LFADAATLPDYQPRRDFQPEYSPEDNSIQPVSLIATVYNEATTVTRWLDSLLVQNRLPDEIIITDGGSTDGTLAVLQRHAESFPVSLQVLSEPGANIARGRNLAIAAASHEIIACSDCGSLPDDNWLNTLLAPFTLDPQIGVSAGYYDVLETNTLSRLARQFFGVNLDAVDPQKFLPSGRSIAFRKRLWVDAGGYPEWLSDAGEDTLFDMRLKSQPARWAFVPAAKVAWYAPDNLKTLIKTYYRYSFGDGETGIAAELYWYKVVEILRIWPKRLMLVMMGLILSWFWPFIGISYFAVLLVWSLTRLWSENQPHKHQLGIGFYPYTVLLEFVGTVQAVAFTLGVLNRQNVKDREIRIYQDQIRDILVQYPQRSGIIVYPPTHDWSFMFQRPHQIARAFARLGWVYFFCTNNNRTDSVYGFREVEPRLYLTNVPPEVFGSLRTPVVYLGSAWNRTWISHFDRPLVIYDHYDDLDVSGAQPEDHFALLQRADLVIVTAKSLLEKVSTTRADALLIPNGVDYDFIQFSKPAAVDLPPTDLLPVLERGNPIIGYSGALAAWFDYDLLMQAASHFSEFSFILIGVDYDGSLQRSGVLEMPNIFYLGMKQYRELFNYIWRFDVAIIPFKVNNITMATSPVKLFEYMACRKPVIVTDLPECREYAAIFLAENNLQFVNFLPEAIQKKEDQSYLSHLDRQAQTNTWEARVLEIMPHLTDCAYEDSNSK